MYTDILIKGGTGPTDGWFRRSVGQTRYTWEAAGKALDRDRDGRVARGEFPGSAADFARLDRDRDGALTLADFDFSLHALNPSPGATLMYLFDRDGNGKVTREELNTFFGDHDSGELGFLSLSDLQDATRPSPPTPGTKPREAPSREDLIRGLFRQEIGSLQPGPALGEKAPDFTLKTNDGGHSWTLSKMVGPKPIVLVFGNFTCGPFRSQAGNIDKLYQMYKDRAEFVMVYVREAHPLDGWAMDSNERVGVALPQPKTYDERVSVAQTCGKRLALALPMLVDTIDDTVGARYSGMPSRLYLIDRDGKVAYKSGRGPYGFKPAELEHSLVLLLQPSAHPRETPTAKVRLTPPAEGHGPVKLLSSGEAWRRLPKVVAGGHPPLPNWALATAHALPRTTAAMLELDRLHRTESPLGPALRAKMRWITADANRCDYSRATAEFDLRRAGVAPKEIDDLGGGPDRWSAAERRALAFARQMSEDASKVTDDEVEALRREYGEEKLVAMVLLLASANFQDRLLLSLGSRLEEGGPVGPVDVKFSADAEAPPVPERRRPSRRPATSVPEQMDDPEWNALGFDDLRRGLETQKRNSGRIRVPSAEEAVAHLPQGYPKPKTPMRIKWSLVCFGYQPRLAAAWATCMRAYNAEAKLDEVFGESLFWVVTRSIHCFY